MYKFMFCTFAFLAWGFWVLSGGSDFQPPEMAGAGESRLATFDIQTPQAPTQVIAADGTPVATVVAAALAVDEPAAQAVQASAAAPAAAEPELTSGLGSALAALEGDNFVPTTTSALSVEPAPPTTTTNVAVAIDPIAIDLREVRASRVNMRNGPSIDFQVLDQLVRGTQVEVIDNPGRGWVQLRVLDSGSLGWMAERLLTPAAN